MVTTVVFCLVTLLSPALAINKFPIYDYRLGLNTDSAEVFNIREKRDVTTVCYDYDSCCDLSNGREDYSMLPCYQRLNKTGVPTEDKIKCIGECMAKTDGYMDENGTVNYQKLSNHLINRLDAYSEWLSKNNANRVVESCILDFIAKTVPPNTCNDIALAIGLCATAKMQLYCPLEQQRSPEKCAAYQEDIRKYRTFPPSIGQLC